MNFLTLLMLASILIISSLPCSSAFHSGVESRSVLPSAVSTIHRPVPPLRRFRFAMLSDDRSSGSIDDNDNNDDDGISSEDDGTTMSATAQDLRSFVTQRCIQSFMFLLASTRDLHTVWWLDNFTQPITINNYDWDTDDDLKPVSIITLPYNVVTVSH